MEQNNFENKIQKQFSKRTLEPSNQAWDRLDAMLAVSEKKTTKKPIWMYIAASVTLFLGLSLFYLLKNDTVTSQEILFKPNHSKTEYTQLPEEKSNRSDTSNTRNTIKKVFTTKTYKTTFNKQQPLFPKKFNPNKSGLAQIINTENIVIPASDIAEQKQTILSNTNTNTTLHKNRKTSAESLLAEIATENATEEIIEDKPTFKDRIWTEIKRAKTTYVNRNIEE